MSNLNSVKLLEPSKALLDRNSGAKQFKSDQKEVELSYTDEKIGKVRSSMQSLTSKKLNPFIVG